MADADVSDWAGEVCVGLHARFVQLQVKAIVRSRHVQSLHRFSPHRQVVIWRACFAGIGRTATVCRSLQVMMLCSARQVSRDAIAFNNFRFCTVGEVGLCWSAKPHARLLRCYSICGCAGVCNLFEATCSVPQSVSQQGLTRT